MLAPKAISPPAIMREFARIQRLPPYVFNITNELKMAARRAGEDIIDMSMGNPDGPTPRHIVAKLVEAAQRPDTHGYSVSKGIPRLRRAICAWYQRRYGVQFDPDSEAIVTIGSKEGLAHLMLACLDRGDTVLVPNPSYPIHIYGAIIAGADIRSVRMTAEVDFLEELARIKSYHDYGTFTPIQVASIVALEGPQDCVAEHRMKYQRRRDVMVKGLREIGWMVENPKASMYIWAKIPEAYAKLGSLEFAKKALRDARVAVSPGIGFGDHGDDHVRIALIENEARTRQAIRGIRDMFRKDGLL